MQNQMVQTGTIGLKITEWGIDGPPLVLVHGIGSRGESWQPVAAPLGDHFHCYALDLRGHGGSAQPDAGYLLPDFASDLDAAIDALGLEQPFVMGHSLGALTVITWAELFPDRAAKLVLEDPPLRHAPNILDMFDGWQALNAAPVEAVAARFQEERPDWSAEECLRRAEAICGTHPAVFAELRAETERALAAGEFSRLDVMAPIATPTLLMYGDPELGSMLPATDAAAFGAVAPALKIVHIADAGHGIHREQPERFMQAVVAFLDA